MPFGHTDVSSVFSVDFCNHTFQHVFFQDTVTLCAYPFVFDAQAKTKMLQTDAELQMQVAVAFSGSFPPFTSSHGPHSVVLCICNSRVTVYQ